jgi:tryptophan-rich hypothetical protein
MAHKVIRTPFSPVSTGMNPKTRTSQNRAPAVNRFNPRKLLLSKWTAVQVENREKHFIVTKLIEPEPPAERPELIELQAVHSGRSYTMAWQALCDGSQWLQGWK